MKDLIEALTIFAKYQINTRNPTHCSHDKLAIMYVGELLSPEDAKRLNELGFLWSESDECWISFRYGNL